MGTCVEFHRIRDFKQYCFNSIPLTSQYRANICSGCAADVDCRASGICHTSSVIHPGHQTVPVTQVIVIVIVVVIVLLIAIVIVIVIVIVIQEMASPSQRTLQACAEPLPVREV